MKYSFIYTSLFIYNIRFFFFFFLEPAGRKERGNEPGHGVRLEGRGRPGSLAEAGQRPRLTDRFGEGKVTTE